MNLHKGLVGHWTMDSADIDSSTAYDKTANDNHATLSGSIQQTSAPIGDGLQFDGSDDLFVFDNMTLDRFGATISFWVNPESASTSYSFVNVGDDYHKMIELEPSGTNCETNSNGNRFNNGNYSLRDEWHHLAVVFENERAYWYEDGTLLSEATNYGIDNYNDENDVDKMVADTTFDRIGDPVYENKYAGGVSDLRIYDRALSDSEINSLYNQRSQQTQTASTWSETFESGNLNQWEVNSASIVQDRTYAGANAAYTNTPLTDAFQFRTAPFTNGKQISRLDYWWQETSSGSFGHGIRLKNSNGNYVLGAGSNNPQWDIEDGNGWESSVRSPAYEEWVRFTFTIDWSAQTFAVDFEQPATDTTYTDSGRPLINATDVQYIEIWDKNNTNWGHGGSLEAWHDSFRVYL